MDVDSLDGRGIGEVDVGHDDRTTLKSGFLFNCVIYITANLLKLLFTFCMKDFEFKV